MRVLLTTDTVGGVWTYAVELCRALAVHDVSIALATMGAPLSPAQRDEVASLENVEVFESSYKLEWMDEPWDDVARAGDWLLEIESDFAPDIVHLNGYAHGALPWRAPVLMAGHSCVLSWWRAVKNQNAPVSWDRYHRLVRDGLRAADLVVAPTPAMLEALDEFYGPFEFSQVIANGRSTHAFAPRPKEPFVFAAGRLWDEAKNIGALEKIASRVEWPVRVAGQNSAPQNSPSSQLSGVEYLGYLAPGVLAQWLSRATIYALPARYEPFGLSILEAGLCGCALVLGDIQSLREVWGEAALYVSPDNEDALAATLNELIQNPSRLQKHGHAARARALQFGAARMGQSYFAAYRHLLQSVPVEERVLA